MGLKEELEGIVSYQGFMGKIESTSAIQVLAKAILNRHYKEK